MGAEAVAAAPGLREARAIPFGSHALGLPHLCPVRYTAVLTRLAPGVRNWRLEREKRLGRSYCWTAPKDAVPEKNLR